MTNLTAERLGEIKLKIQPILNKIAEDVATWENTPLELPPSKASPRKLTLQRLKERIHYDPETGVLKWLTGMNVGKLAGYHSFTRNKSYWRVKIGGECILGHSLAWLYVYGEWPDFELDHIDGNGLNNSIANLRPSSRLLNNNNTSKRKDTKHKNLALQLNGSYQVLVKFNRIEYYLGTWPDLENALTVRDMAQSLMPRSDQHGKINPLKERK